MSIFGKTDAERKACPVLDGAILYFPRALAAIARHSLKANQKHNPGEPLHWAKHKSTDHLNTAVRHIIDFKMGIMDDGEYDNLTAAGWRVLAALDTELERREKCAAMEAVRYKVADQVPQTKRLDENGRGHCVPEGANWLPSDNCSCDTCRLWIGPRRAAPLTAAEAYDRYMKGAAISTAIDRCTESDKVVKYDLGTGKRTTLRDIEVTGQADACAAQTAAAHADSWRRQCTDIQCVLDVNHWGICRAGNGDGIHKG